VKTPEVEMVESNWKNIYKLGAIAALLAVITGVVEIAISYLPGAGKLGAGAVTINDWFALLQANPFIGMRNLGLINIFLTSFGVLIFFSLFAAHRRVSPGSAALVLIVALIGAAVFFATNRCFAMLALSNQYAAATDEAQRTALVAAGQAMLAVGQSHTPGTFLAMAFSEVASILMALVMLRGKVFSQASAYVGMLGFACMLTFEIISSFVSGLSGSAMWFAMIGGLLSMAWYILVARRLFQLAK
jgi:hypothetical protein